MSHNAEIIRLLIKQAADPNENLALGAMDIPRKPITVTVPPGMEWDRPGQETEYQDMIRRMRPDLSAHLVRGHGGGSSGSYVVRPRSRNSTDLNDLLLNAKNTRGIREVMQAVKRQHQGIPDLLFLGQCNKQYCDVPMEIKDSVGALPNRLVYTSPGAYSNTGVSREALRYALNEKRPLLLPSEKEFREGKASVRARIQPLIKPHVSVPAALAAASLLANEVIQRSRGKKNSWWRRAAFGAGGAALGGMGLLLYDKMRRAKANEGMFIPNFVDVGGNEVAPLVAST